MTIESVVPSGRLYSCLSTDTKPDGWASGLLMIETDTGIWWITDDGQQWQPCYVSAAQDAALADLVGEVTTELVVMEARLKALEKFLGPP